MAGDLFQNSSDFWQRKIPWTTVWWVKGHQCGGNINPLNPELNPICYFWHY